MHRGAERVCVGTSCQRSLVPALAQNRTDLIHRRVANWGMASCPAGPGRPVHAQVQPRGNSNADAGRTIPLAIRIVDSPRMGSSSAIEPWAKLTASQLPALGGLKQALGLVALNQHPIPSHPDPCVELHLERLELLLKAISPLLPVVRLAFLDCRGKQGRWESE